MAHGVTRELVDAHVHLWDLAATPQPWIDPETMPAIARDFDAGDLAAQLEAVRDASAEARSHAIVSSAGAVVVQADHSLAETRWLLDQALLEPGAVVGVVGWVDLSGDVAAQLGEFAGHAARDRLVGVRHLAHVDADPEWLLRDDVTAGVAALGEHGLAFDLVVRPWQLAAATTLASRVPGTRLVLDHLGNPPLVKGDFVRWRAELDALARHEHVSAKVSGLVSSDDPVAASPARLERTFAAALDAFGADRLMFGSDWPLVQLGSGGYAGWLAAYLRLTAPLAAGERAAIDAGTARTAYRIGRSAAAGVAAGAATAGAAVAAAGGAAPLEGIAS